uniref:Uncharacterized protein n=1 Tax=Anguilla anguilla TaxID=7936 RepID=A0A0E9QUS0_ANGAN
MMVLRGPRETHKRVNNRTYLHGKSN